MSGFLLDTNVLSEFKRRGEPDPHVRDWLRATDPDLLWASVLSFGEIRKGIERLAIGKRRTGMAGKMQFEQLLESRAVKYVMFDVTWCGGLTEAHKIAGMADAFELPIAPHTAGGPLLFYATTHLSTASPNVWIQESCQRFYERDWPAMLENPIAPQNGFIRVPEESGFGMQIKPEAWNHPAVVRQVSGRS